MNEAQWTAIVVALLTGGGGLWTAIHTKKKIDADSESVSVSTMRAVVESVREELARCHSDRAVVLERLDNAERRIRSLENYIKLNHGVDPGDINGQPV